MYRSGCVGGGDRNKGDPFRGAGGMLYTSQAVIFVDIDDAKIPIVKEYGERFGFGGHIFF